MGKRSQFREIRGLLTNSDILLSSTKAVNHKACQVMSIYIP